MEGATLTIDFTGNEEELHELIESIEDDHDAIVQETRTFP